MGHDGDGDRRRYGLLEGVPATGFSIQISSLCIFVLRHNPPTSWLLPPRMGLRSWISRRELPPDVNPAITTPAQKSPILKAHAALEEGPGRSSSPKNGQQKRGTAADQSRHQYHHTAGRTNYTAPKPTPTSSHPRLRTPPACPSPSRGARPLRRVWQAAAPVHVVVCIRSWYSQNLPCWP